MSCKCGRSPTGKCIGWHNLTEDRYLEAKEKWDDEQLVKQYLEHGGKITYCPPDARTEEIEFKGSFYTKRKRAKEEKENK